MALSTDNARRTQVVDPQAYKARLPARDVDSRLPMAFFGRAVDTLDHGDEGPPVSLDPTPQQYAKFHKAIWTLADPRVERLMVYLESIGTGFHPSYADGRFGTNGISRLSQLTEDSPEWTSKSMPQGKEGYVTSPEERLEIIDAARTALLYNNPGGLLSRVHLGDQVFAPGEMARWCETNPAGVIGPFQQNPGSASSPFTAALLAVSESRDAGSLLDMIKVDANGNYNVTFRGDPRQTNQRTVFVPREAVLGNPLGSSGSFDVRILEEAARRYYPKVHVDGVDHDNWGDEASNLTLLTGASPQLAGPWPTEVPAPPAVDRTVLLRLQGNEIDGTSMTFSYRHPDGRVRAYAFTNISHDTVYFRDPHDSQKAQQISIDELLAKPQLRVASVVAAA